MEDIIPFLIIIVISIVGAIGSRRKKRNAGENIAEPNRRVIEDDIFDWLDKLKITDEEHSVLGEPEIEESQLKQREEPNKREPAVEVVTVPGIFEKYSGFISPKEREEIMSKEGIPTVKLDPFAEGDLTKQNINSQVERKREKIEIDLRKAVIYSEIYNRKYKF